MTDSLFQRYVASGGWPMLLLIPASVVCVAAVVRGLLLIRRGAICGPGEGAEQSGCAGHVVARLDAIRTAHGTVTPEDVRAEIAAEVLDLYSSLQPLAAMYVLAPLVGMLGSVTAVMSGNLDVARGMAPAALAAAMERALVPLMWGLGVAVVAYAGFAWLRARLYLLERTLLVPRVESAVAAWQKGVRRDGSLRAALRHEREPAGHDSPTGPGEEP